MRSLTIGMLVCVACSPAPEAPPVRVAPIASASAAPTAAPEGAGHVDDARAAQLAAEADQMQMQMLAAMADGGSTTGRDLELGGGGGPVQSSGSGGGLVGIGNGAAPIPPAKGDATIENIATVPSVANAPRVMAIVRARFRQCYRVGLASDPTIQGRVGIAVTINAAGEVTAAQVTPVKGSMLGNNVEACVTRSLKNLTFDAPSSAPAKLTASVLFEAK